MMISSPIYDLPLVALDDVAGPDAVAWIGAAIVVDMHLASDLLSRGYVGHLHGHVARVANIGPRLRHAFPTAPDMIRAIQQWVDAHRATLEAIDLGEGHNAYDGVVQFLTVSLSAAELILRQMATRVRGEESLH